MNISFIVPPELSIQPQKENVQQRKSLKIFDCEKKLSRCDLEAMTCKDLSYNILLGHADQEEMIY